MSRTIVIPDANFTVNRLDVVELGDIIPCTGLEISQSTIAFTAINATQTLTVTKTPADTTQRVYWTSSNENVAMVADGVVTCVGVGSCTITATCGQQTVTCSVSSTVTYTASNVAYTNGLAPLLRDDYDYISNNNDATKLRTYYDPNNTLNGYIMGANPAKYGGKYPIPIPHNASSITVSYHKSFNRTYQKWALLNSQELSTQTSADNPCARVYAINNDVSNPASGDIRSFTISLENVSANVDSFMFMIGSASYDADTLSTDITIEFTGT